jgi:hypothetical protein
VTPTDKITIQWLAGWLEGEGSFVCKKSGVHVGATSTDRDVIEDIALTFGGSVYAITKRQAHWKDAWVWGINGAKAYDLCKRLYPYMHSRRQQSIDRLLRQYEFSPRKATSDRIRSRISLVLRLRADGLKHREIAEIVKVERSVVSHILRKNRFGVRGEKESR